jgi:hypothetical protein
MPNRGTILKPISLWTKEQPIGHWVSSIGTGMKWKVWTRGQQKRPSYRKQSLVGGIMFEIYPRKRGIHTFQAPSTIQKHGDDKNLEDKSSDRKHDKVLNCLTNMCGSYQGTIVMTHLCR